MIKIVGIGGCGNNILNFIKKQNFQNKRRDYEFISVKKDDDMENINFSSDDTFFTISGLGGNTGGNLTIALSKKLINNNIKIKNIIILPFSLESNKDKVIKEFEDLQSINQNIEVFPNDSISDDENISMLQMMQLMDQKIYDRVSRKDQIKWKSFFIEQKKNDTVYKAYVRYWSKDIVMTLLKPNFQFIGDTHMLYMAPTRFARKNETDDSFIDIEEIVMNRLSSYILKQN